MNYVKDKPRATLPQCCNLQQQQNTFVQTYKLQTVEGVWSMDTSVVIILLHLYPIYIYSLLESGNCIVGY